ncbi:MAG: sigma-54-dependent Fis family transcriptional regulator [Desulfobacteraceae bacterium]|jgi:Nif-specific regulatory protein|nr:sigma-54-dependent Fis family transcriptional regulator [Desulfobacteraceae bacterium]
MASHQENKDIAIGQLKNISSWVSSVQDLNQLLELILHTGTRIMHAKASSLLLLDQKTQKLHFKVTTGTQKDKMKNFAISLGQGIVGHVAETGESLLIEDVSRDKRWYRNISDEIGFKTQSILCVPMKANDKVIGAIEFINKAEGEAFQKSDLELLNVFADVAALAIVNAKKFQISERENKGLKQALGTAHQIIGQSKDIKAVVNDALKVADSRASTLILGESGTGKELLASLIHQASSRKERYMVTLNCAAVPETLLEDELFGHEKGSFTGANERKIGKLELADGNTLFLDEIGEMSPAMQAKVLRVLQDGIFYRVGGNAPISVDIRIIAATNQNLTERIASGDFREDLYYRLNVVELHMPALRERKKDIPLIARHFVDMFQKEKGHFQIEISAPAMDIMTKYNWPGNVRELRNAIERAVVMGNGREILPEDLPILNTRASIETIEYGLTLQEAMDDFKKRFIKVNLEHTNGNQSKAAAVMGIQRTYLSRLISKYNMKK